MEKKKDKCQKRIEEYMNLERLTTATDAKNIARVNHLVYLRNLLNGLIMEYGQEEGKKIFSLMLNDSSEYREMIANSFGLKEDIDNFRSKK